MKNNFSFQIIYKTRNRMEICIEKSQKDNVNVELDRSLIVFHYKVFRGLYFIYTCCFVFSMEMMDKNDYNKIISQVSILSFPSYTFRFRIFPYLLAKSFASASLLIDSTTIIASHICNILLVLCCIIIH